MPSKHPCPFMWESHPQNKFTHTSIYQQYQGHVKINILSWRKHRHIIIGKLTLSGTSDDFFSLFHELNWRQGLFNIISNKALIFFLTLNGQKWCEWNLKFGRTCLMSSWPDNLPQRRFEWIIFYLLSDLFDINRLTNNFEDFIF